MCIHVHTYTCRCVCTYHTKHIMYFDSWIQAEMCVCIYIYIYIYIYICMYRITCTHIRANIKKKKSWMYTNKRRWEVLHESCAFGHKELPAELIAYFLRSIKSNINQLIRWAAHSAMWVSTIMLYTYRHSVGFRSDAGLLVSTMEAPSLELLAFDTVRDRRRSRWVSQLRYPCASDREDRRDRRFLALFRRQDQ